MSERDPFNVEMEMLQAFYREWKGFHSIPNDKLHKKQKQTAAQNLYDRSVILENFYNPTRLQVVQ